MNQNPLDLNQLTMDDIDFSGACEGMEHLKKLEKEYQEKYGDDWWKYYKKVLFSKSDYDLDEKNINDAIYHGCTLCLTGDPEAVSCIENKYIEKMKRLFGKSYKRHIFHKSNDTKVNKLLIRDAIKTGMWKELPNELQEEYHKLVEKQNG